MFFRHLGFMKLDFSLQMHIRNIYKNPPNFGELAKKHAFLAPFLSLNANGAPKINFRDQNALRALTKALLAEDFHLHVEIPDHVLVPTVPLRLNYILWLEDLLSFNDCFGKSGTEICGIDVGTGATAIYALLAAKKNQWKMVGSDIEPESVMVARSNVKRNIMEELIQIRHMKNSVLGELLQGSSAGQYEFTMCNPPFFGTEDEADSATKTRKDRPEPSGAKTGTKNELIVPGGEIEFIFKMIQDSKNYPYAVRIFTTMIGIKSHVKEVTFKLKSENIKNFATTEFSQGKTSRWGVAWSLDAKICLTPPAQVSHTFEKLPGCLNFENYIFDHLKTLNFKNLEWITNLSSDEPDDGQTLHFIATESTWTGQRRKKREMERLAKLNSTQSQEPPKKMLKLDESTSGTGEKMECDSTSTSEQTLAPVRILLESQMKVVRQGPRALIQMSLLNGTLGKDGLNQILTYLKNSYNRDSQNPSTELYQLLKG